MNADLGHFLLELALAIVGGIVTIFTGLVVFFAKRFVTRQDKMVADVAELKERVATIEGRESAGDTPAHRS